MVACISKWTEPFRFALGKQPPAKCCESNTMAKGRRLRPRVIFRRAWIHRLPFLHFEGKGSIPRPSLDGAMLINRWHFTTVWSEAVKNGLCGKNPEGFPARGQQ